MNSTLAIVKNDHLDLHATPGQFLLVVPPTFDPYLPQVVFPFKIEDRVVRSFLAPPYVHSWARLGPLQVRGPYGNGFSLPPGGSRALVLATDARSGGITVPLLDSLVGRGCEVSLVCAPEVTSQQWLSPEVEIRISEDILAVSSPLWHWADAVFACGGAEFYDQLITTLREERLRLEAGWGQLLLHDMAIPCGTGLCYLCSVRTRRGVVLNCREGPVYDLVDWIIES